MDYGRSPAEVDLIDRLHGLVQDAGARHDLLALASAGQIDAELEDDLAGVVAPETPLHERLLVVEEAARLGLPALPGARILIGWAVLDPGSPTPVAVVDRRRSGPVRHAPTSRSAIVLDGEDGWVVDLTGRPVTRIDSSFGYPYGQFPADETISSGLQLTPEAAARARRRWQLALAAEIAGTASGALGHVAAYLKERRQFGQRLANFQALRHRVAELAVSTEAALWLAREAAWYDDADHAGVALSYARDLAAAMVPEVVQLSGARGLTVAFPAHLFAMRLEGLRLEVGSADRLARSLSLVTDGPSA